MLVLIALNVDNLAKLCLCGCSSGLVFDMEEFMASQFREKDANSLHLLTDKETHHPGYQENT